METKRICPSCQKTLPPNVPLGLCPECLIKSGFNTGTEPGNPGKATGFVPPPVEEIRKLFPLLEIIELIGKGGMGAVYKARQPTLDRFVALKILPPGAADDAGFAERFNREARALARLNHPHIVAVHDFGQLGGQPYLVMEFVDGPNLRQVEQAGRLTPEQALEIVPQICEALQFAHNEGVVHRDIKPENILLDKKGRVKITDFGIAKIVGVPAGKSALTGAKDFLGTPHYMAPEQVEKPQTVDHRADIYSLGVVFYEMLTGELPLGKFQSPSKKVQMDVRLDEVVLHTLEKEPERRYQHVSEVQTDVETIASSPAPPPPSPVSPAVAQRRHGLEVKSTVLFFAAACFLVASVLFASSGNEIAALLSVVAIIGFSIAGYRHFRAAPTISPQSPAADGRVTPGVRSQAQAPAIGILIVGVLNFLLLIVVCLRQLNARPLVLVAGAITGLVIVGAIQMWRSKTYALAVAASILAMIIPPACFLGLPLGIWALVVLNRREVREAFGKEVSHPAEAAASAAPPAPRPDRFWRLFALAVALVLLAMILIPVGSILVAIAIPNLSKARQRAQAIAADSSRFGQVVELTITDLADLDKETLVHLPLPGALSDRDPARYDWFNRDTNAFSWMRQQGVDLFQANHGLIGVDLLVVPLESKDWRGLTPAGLRSKLDGLQLPAAPPSSVINNERRPFGFQTRAGALGIFEITDTHLPRGVKLRYKLVQGDGREIQSAMSAVSGTQTDRMASKQIAQLRLQSAIREVKEAENQFALGQITSYEVQKAKLGRDIAAAELEGDIVKAARLKLQICDLDLDVVGKRLVVGKATQQEHEKAQFARDEAAVYLREIQKTRSQ